MSRGLAQNVSAIASHLFLPYLHPQRAQRCSMKHGRFVPEMALCENEFSGFRNLRSRLYARMDEHVGRSRHKKKKNERHRIKQ